MGKLYTSFVKSISNPNTKKTLTSTYKHIGDYEDSSKTLEDVKRIFYATKVDSPQAVRNFRAQFRNFASYIDDHALQLMLNDIDELEICTKVKELGVKKYFSNSSFSKAYNSINNSSTLNPFYVQTLFLCIYEGIYSSDFSVLANLTASDISGTMVACRPNNEDSYIIEISNELATRLNELSRTNSWTRIKRGSYSEQTIVGKSHDSCFKVEVRDIANRKSDPETIYENVYRRLLREIVSVELGYNVSAFDIYISGIMHRISTNLQSCGISVLEAFTKNNRDVQTKQIIQNELNRCHYNKPVSSFKNLVRGHLEVFIPTQESIDHSRVILIRPDTQRLNDEEIQDYITYKNIECDHSTLLFTPLIGHPRPKKDMVEISGRKVYPREKAIAQFALRMADYKCEVDGEHPSFISKSSSLPYTEPHHLIPLAYAEYFDVSLDVPENIVALCSNCHNQIHYGKDIKKILKWLYENRKSKLEQVGLKISFENLLWMYNVVD